MSLLIAFLCLNLITFGQSFYEIPSYYGHWSLNFFVPSYIKAGSITYFQFNFQICLDYKNQTLYISKSTRNSIESFNLTSKIGNIVAGSKLKSGNREGDTQNALFSSPSSLVFYQPNNQSLRIAQLSNTYIVRNQSCNLTTSGCILQDSQLQTINISMQNIRIYPQFYLYPQIDSTRQSYIYVADTQNHCIKRISLQIQIVDVVAGICGVSGFLDGPLGYNRLYKPSNIGIDSKGIIFFYDLGNQYMRKIVGLQVQTLFNGACKQYSKTGQQNRKIFDYEIKKIICYQNWVQKTTQNPIQHYFADTILNICLQQSSKCPNYGL